MKIKYLRTVLLVPMLLVCFLVTSANAIECKDPQPVSLAVGQKVVASWRGNNWWIAEITAIKGDYIEITYSDKTTGIKKKNEVLPHPDFLYAGGIIPCLKIGDSVVSVWQGDSWWVAKIDKVTEDIAEITYSDGEKGIHKLNEMVKLSQ